ncbi:hypothetical protein OVY01_22650 [Robbsia sp. Bb-Pol-6]|uniref:Replication protein O n=1 Tax=Robbsia betulipollinis TaxID=2981849 RepID=A0ABT3ZVR9_9BURK|nr:hypothetical protein [Robbsia betulipollinis]MCY0389943.1 hypothetical protein [Robbsia betulipollinis]
MSIAQQHVASEGEIRPAVTNFTALSDEPRSPEYATDATNLKWLTLRAEHRAYHLSGISNRARAVLAALARTVDNLRPNDKIFASRAILQDRAMTSERTFFRALADLAQAGLIVRYEQWEVAGRAGFNRAYLALSERAIALLGLNEKTTPRYARSSSSSAANDDQSQNLAEGTDSMADPIKRDLYPASQQRQPGQLPSDLQRLLDLGFHEFLVFKLMRDAKRQGKFLSDVVAASWQHLKAAAKPICYLQALLRSATDFTALSRYQKCAKAEVETRHSEMLQLGRDIENLAGHVFYDTAGTRRIAISSDGLTAVLDHAHDRVPRVAAGAWQKDFIRALASGQWTEATVDLDAAFSAPQARTRVQSATGEEQRAHPREALSALRAMIRGPRINAPEQPAA